MSRPAAVVHHLRAPTLLRIAAAGRLGIVELATEFSLTREMARMLPAGVELHTNRLHVTNPLSMDKLRAAAEGDLTRAAAGILPGYGVDALAYACTSGALSLGPPAVHALLRAAHPDAEVTDPLTASVRALEAVRCGRLAVLTPYYKEANVAMCEYYARAGFDVVYFAGFGFSSDRDTASICPRALRQAALEHTPAEAEALFISCTALRCVALIGELENLLGIPVVTSNQAMLWHCLQLLRKRNLETPPPVQGYGKLFEKTLIRQ